MTTSRERVMTAVNLGEPDRVPPANIVAIYDTVNT